MNVPHVMDLLKNISSEGIHDAWVVNCKLRFFFLNTGLFFQKLQFLICTHSSLRTSSSSIEAPANWNISGGVIENLRFQWEVLGLCYEVVFRLIWNLYVLIGDDQHSCHLLWDIGHLRELATHAMGACRSWRCFPEKIVFTSGRQCVTMRYIFRYNIEWVIISQTVHRMINAFGIRIFFLPLLFYHLKRAIERKLGLVFLGCLLRGHSFMAQNISDFLGLLSFFETLLDCRKNFWIINNFLLLLDNRLCWCDFWLSFWIELQIPVTLQFWVFHFVFLKLWSPLLC
jgi:hypothetical protein